jgi:hypothetical protein
MTESLQGGVSLGACRERNQDLDIRTLERVAVPVPGYTLPRNVHRIMDTTQDLHNGIPPVWHSKVK